MTDKDLLIKLTMYIHTKRKRLAQRANDGGEFRLKLEKQLEELEDMRKKLETFIAEDEALEDLVPKSATLRR